jgi:hypothetical protein
VLLGAEHKNLISAEAALDGSLNVSTSQTAAGEALNALAVRFSAGNDRLAELVRKDQDLVGEAGKLETAIIAAVSAEPSRRDAAKERRIRDRIAAITKERDDLQAVFTRDFPGYAALSKPQPLTLKDIHALLADDEASPAPPGGLVGTRQKRKNPRRFGVHLENPGRLQRPKEMRHGRLHRQRTTAPSQCRARHAAVVGFA